MKIIDLLNKIANGEEVPKKINYMGEVYLKAQYDDTQNFMIDYLSEESENAFFDTYNISAIINDEVEIIEETPIISKLYINNELQYDLEEKKIPEKLDMQYDDIKYNGDSFFREQILMYCDNLQYKINEIIDYLKENNGRD